MRLNGLTTALTAIAFSVSAHAADINWQTPADETGSTSDIVTIGTPFDAVTANTGVTVGGVTFRGPSSYSANTLNFGAGSHITVSGVTTGHAAFGTTPPSGWDSNYRTLVYGGAYAGTPTATAINLSGLIFGRQYTVQILESFWDLDWATTFTGGANTSLPVAVAGPAVPGPVIRGAPAATVPQYLIGSFIADGATETITLGSPAGIYIFDAMQVRDTTLLSESTVAAPEPSSLVVAATGAGLLGFIRRRRAAKAA